MDIAGYQEIVEIGRGRASTVHRAVQESTGRVVAIKVLTVSGVEERLLRRFERESAVTGRLGGHRHIAEVVDRGYTSEGHPYLSTPYYDHGSLEDRLARSGPLPVGDVLRVGIQLAGALEVVHRAGILHRDVKPSNVLESLDGDPALTGFGISAIDPSSQAMTMAQSFAAAHTPPEVVLGQPATTASDTYQLASTLYSLLAGRAPFDSGSDDGIIALLGRIQSAEVPAFERSDVPQELLATLRAALAKDPAERPSLVDLAGRLQAHERALGQAPTPMTAEPVAPGRAGVDGASGDAPAPPPPPPPPPPAAPDPDGQAGPVPPVPGVPVPPGYPAQPAPPGYGPGQPATPIPAAPAYLPAPPAQGYVPGAGAPAPGPGGTSTGAVVALALALVAVLAVLAVVALLVLARLAVAP